MIIIRTVGIGGSPMSCSGMCVCRYSSCLFRVCSEEMGRSHGLEGANRNEYFFLFLNNECSLRAGVCVCACVGSVPLEPVQDARGLDVWLVRVNRNTSCVCTVVSLLRVLPRALLTGTTLTGCFNMCDYLLTKLIYFLCYIFHIFVILVADK